jgi:hypothetical protein
MMVGVKLLGLCFSVAVHFFRVVSAQECCSFSKWASSTNYSLKMRLLRQERLELR